ncbi:type 2 periplasmic-binding domain-containing protein [Mongoliitalea daihaiensis]|uniref:ABC transporter substrate-binding protein n=1 Tax=Mongoliitalea daihaiensis TaxID=2782006 RepID=UPI001F38B0DF|nr:ABC transporter substrate-binding protein [Mongoliitalea daihaiensis]UJP64547.1 ABC transporter substrate-binding protein [Mongoliitalea daihaiensis]
MQQIRITGVPEHFNFLWKKLIQSQPYLDQGYELIWIDEPKGSGAMNAALRNNETDLAIILTESFIQDKVKGNPALITDWYVSSPLTWGIHTTARLQKRPLQSYTAPTIAISRYGSGSHLMAFVLAKREAWNISQISFEVINDLKGAIRNAEDSKDHIFLWEKFTTNPYVLTGVFHRIGEIPTPWPCFVTVAREDFLTTHQPIMQQLQQAIKSLANGVKKDPETILAISQEYGLLEADVAAWIHQTEWAQTNEISITTIRKIIQILEELKLIDQSIEVSSLISKELVVLTP